MGDHLPSGFGSDFVRVSGSFFTEGPSIESVPRGVIGVGGSGHSVVAIRPNSVSASDAAGRSGSCAKHTMLAGISVLGITKKRYMGLLCNV